MQKKLKVNGEATEAEDLEFAIKKGKRKIEIEFNAAPFFKERPNDLYALQMGSLLFSVPIAYEKEMREYTKKGVERNFPYCDYYFIPKTSWNYGFSGADFEISRNGAGNIPFSQDNPPVTITAKMQQIDWELKFPYRSVAGKRRNQENQYPKCRKLSFVRTDVQGFE